MARTPRAKVSKTTGAGVSRLSYQQGYAKGNRGSAAAGGGVPSVPGAKQSITNESLKASRGTKPKGNDPGGINISYGETLPIGDLKDVEAIGKMTPPKSPDYLKQGKAVKLGDKGRSAYAKK